MSAQGRSLTELCGLPTGLTEGVANHLSAEVLWQYVCHFAFASLTNGQGQESGLFLQGFVQDKVGGRPGLAFPKRALGARGLL